MKLFICQISIFIRYFLVFLFELPHLAHFSYRTVSTNINTSKFRGSTSKPQFRQMKYQGIYHLGFDLSNENGITIIQWINFNQTPSYLENAQCIIPPVPENILFLTKDSQTSKNYYFFLKNEGLTFHPCSAFFFH